MKNLPKKNLYQLLENTSETIMCNSKVNPKMTKIEWYKNGVYFSSKYCTNCFDQSKPSLIILFIGFFFF